MLVGCLHSSPVGNGGAGVFIHPSIKKNIYMGRLWCLFWYSLSKTSIECSQKKELDWMERLNPKSFLLLTTPSNFLNCCVLKKASTASAAIWAQHKWLQVEFICWLAKPLEWMKAGEVWCWSWEQYGAAGPYELFKVLPEFSFFSRKKKLFLPQTQYLIIPSPGRT